MTAHTEREGLRAHVRDLQRQIVRLRAEHMAARDRALEQAENEMRRRAHDWSSFGRREAAGGWLAAAVLIAEMRRGKP